VARNFYGGTVNGVNVEMKISQSAEAQLFATLFQEQTNSSGRYMRIFRTATLFEKHTSLSINGNRFVGHSRVRQRLSARRSAAQKIAHRRRSLVSFSSSPTQGGRHGDRR